MSRFLLSVWSLESHVNPNLAVASALRQAGHEVAFYAGSQAAAEIEDNQFQVFPFQALREDIASTQFDALLEDQGSARKLSQHFSDLLVAQLVPQVDDLNRIVDSWKPDVLVTDMAMVAPFGILHDLGRVRVAVLSHVGYCMVPGPQGPIPGRALPPRTSVVSRLQAWAIQTAANYMTRQVPKDIDAIRKRYDLPATGLRITELHARAGLLLIPSVPELDYSRTDLPPTVRYIGSLAWPAADIVPPKPNTIAVEEGGYYRKDPFLLRTASRAFANSSSEVTLIPGRSRDPHVFDPLPSNVVIGEDAPEASVVITTGNTESILRALSRGIPLVVVPSLLDQTEMAWRVKLAGAGEFLPEKSCSAERLLDTTKRVMINPTYKSRAVELAASINGRGGPIEAVRLLDELAQFKR